MKSLCVCLTSKKTGEQFIFEKQIEADRFLGKSKGYCGRQVAVGSPIVDQNKQEYEFSVLGISEYEWKGREGAYKPQLCTTCARAYGICSWSNRFEPVEGWNATRTYDADGLPYSYSVKECPLYEEDKKSYKEKREQFKRLRSEFVGREKNVCKDNRSER